MSGRHLEVGQVSPCRVLGAVCLIDEGQADWKIFATRLTTERYNSSMQYTMLYSAIQ